MTIDPRWLDEVGLACDFLGAFLMVCKGMRNVTIQEHSLYDTTF
jgi:hypothetical protein